MNSSVENLYQAFSKYRFRPNVSACPHCVTKSDNENLQKKNLKELTAKDLEKYVFKAVTTWGDEYDFKHFLPRLLELWDELPMGMVFIKLQSNHWETWPKHEKDAIVAYLESCLESLRRKHSQQPDSTLEYGMSLETIDLEIKIEEISDFLRL
jgi:hypothetical protein